MTDPTDMTRLEFAQLLQNFIDARIAVFMCRHENQSNSTWQSVNNQSDKIFNQLAGIE